MQRLQLDVDRLPKDPSTKALQGTPEDFAGASRQGSVDALHETPGFMLAQASGN